MWDLRRIWLSRDNVPSSEGKEVTVSLQTELTLPAADRGHGVWDRLPGKVKLCASLSCEEVKVSLPGRSGTRLPQPQVGGGEAAFQSVAPKALPIGVPPFSSIRPQRTGPPPAGCSARLPPPQALGKGSCRAGGLTAVTALPSAGSPERR